jgi:prophage maintenance system killer protein
MIEFTAPDEQHVATGVARVAVAEKSWSHEVAEQPNIYGPPPSAPERDLDAAAARVVVDYQDALDRLSK